MENEFVSYTQALALKELRFDEHCIGWYNPQVNYKEVTTDKYWAFHLTGEWENFKPAPLYQQAFRWFREKHNLIYTIEEVWEGDTEYYVVEITTHNRVDDFLQECTYEEAELACLKKLIEIVKNK
mgnify:CR=1 FL=1